MSRITIVDNDYITVEYWEEKGIIYHTVHQPVGGPVLRDALNTATEELGRRGACKWLSDDRKNGPLSDEDREWGFNDWNRRAVDTGWKYWALVVPQELAAAGAMSQTIEDLWGIGLRVMVFTDVASAVEWLDSQPG